LPERIVIGEESTFGGRQGEKSEQLHLPLGKGSEEGIWGATRGREGITAGDPILYLRKRMGQKRLKASEEQVLPCPRHFGEKNRA